MLHAIAAPEGIRQQLELGSLDLEDPVTAFSQEDFDKFLKGYQSQYNELSTWIKDEDIEGTHYAKGLCDTSPA